MRPKRTEAEVLFNRQLGTRIREARERAHLTMGQLAAGMGVSVAYLSEMERGRMRCPVYRLAQISLLLNTPVSSLVRVFMSA